MGSKTGNEVVLRGIEAPEQLRKWFLAKGHRNLVFRVEDLVGLQPYFQKAVALFAEQVSDVASVAYATVKNHLLALARDGYILLPVEKLLDGRFPIAQLELLQEIASNYRDYRHQKGYPTVRKARESDGEEVVVLVEMSDEEITLAEAPL